MKRENYVKCDQCSQWFYLSAEKQKKMDISAPCICPSCELRRKTREETKTVQDIHGKQE